MTQPALAQIAAAVRTPIGRFQGALSHYSAVELGVLAARSALERADVAPDSVDLMILGNARPAGLGPNPARQVAVAAGLPHETPAFTLNMACGSSSQAIVQGIQALALGRARRVLVAGAECLSRVPYLLPQARFGYRMGHAPLVDAMYRDGFDCPLCGQVMGETAETLAREFGISRADSDAYALESQRRAAAAWESGAFAAEVVAVPGEGRKPGLDRDEHLRPGTTLAKLAQLQPVFAVDGCVTAGSSSGITDGAAAVVLEAAGMRSAPLAEILDYELAGVDPARMGLGPVPATTQLLRRRGLSVGDLDLVELNEAFAVQVLACAQELKLDLARTNVRGGAIALGHPVGATGARITTTLAHAIAGTGADLGLSTLCVSGGLGVSLLLRRPQSS